MLKNTLRECILKLKKIVWSQNDSIKIIDDNLPDLYNASGEKLKIWYLDSPSTRHIGYEYGSNIIWDKHNDWLETRFFCDQSLLVERDHTNKRDYAWLREARSIIPDVYKTLIEKPNLLKKYKAVFTYDEEVLSTFDNAYNFQNYEMWYGTNRQGGAFLEDRYKMKIKNISMVCSNKLLCDMHIFRHSIANHYMNIEKNVVDVFGTVDGGMELPQKNASLDAYMYQIVIENDATNNYYTEKILDCFAAQVIPIYYGAPNIGSFFNLNGIIQIRDNSIAAVREAVSMCTKEWYYAHVNEIIENYYKSLEYINTTDHLISQYGFMFE